MLNRFLSRLVAGLVWSVCASVWAQDLEMSLSRADDTAFSVRVVGPEGEPVIIELSPDLVNWRAVEAGAIQAGGIGTNRALTGLRNFFRARVSNESVLLSEENPIFAGDTVVLRVTGTSGSNWEWSVNGAVGGDATVGTIRPNPLNAASSIYTAPATAPGDPVTISGRNLDTGETVATSLDIEDLLAELVIVPGDSVLGVGKSLQFRAGVQVEGLGFIPFTRPIWKVNGLVGGIPELGTITLGGLYQAPPVLPDSLPAEIEIGYSLTVEQNVLGSVAINLVDLIVTPGETVRFYPSDSTIETEPPTQLTATLHFSDGSTQPSPGGTTIWSSDLPGIVTVDGAGLLTIHDEVGPAVITAENTLFGVVGTASVKARNPIFLFTMDAIPEAGVAVNLESGIFDPATSTNRQIIEVTQPRVTLALDPRMRISRSMFSNLSGPDPATFSGRDLPAITYEDDDNGSVVVYDQFGRIVQNNGLTARLEKRTAILEFGDVPGAGNFSLLYDDGEWDSRAELLARYTQLDLEASAVGSLSGGTNEMFITEWADFTVRLLNPFYQDFDNGESRFVPRSPVEVTIEGGDEFWVAYSEYVRDGTRAPGSFSENFNRSAIIEKTDRFVGYVAPVLNPTDLFRPARQPEDGTIAFSISPTRTGEITYIVRHLLDPNVPEQRITVNYVQPTLSFDDGPLRHLIPPENQLPAGGWLNFAEPSDEPNVRAIAFSQFTRWADITPPQWVVQRPDGETEITSVSPGNLNFNQFFDIPGEYRVQKRLRDRPEIATEAFVFTAPDLDQLSPWPAINPASHEWNNSGSTVPTNMILGGVKLLSPLRGVWKPGESIDVILQTYDAAGNADRIGYTTRTTFQGGPSPSVTDNTTLIFPQVSRAGGPGWQLEVVNESDPQGRTQLRLNFPETLDSPDFHGQDQFPSVSLRQASSPDFAPFTGDRLFETVFVYNSTTNTYQLASGPPIGPPSLRAANYEEADWQVLWNHCFRISGRGAIFSPSRLPIATQRLREAVAAGKLPAGSEHLTVQVTGTEGFAEAAATGVTGVDLGDGLALVDSSVSGDQVTLTISSDLAYWEANPGELRSRSVTLTFNDESDWEGTIELFQATLEPENQNEEWDLPLSARYDLTAPESAINIRINRLGNVVANAELELIPSIHASWDVDRDGIADDNEDTNGDGVFDETDVASGVAPFRGQFAASPLLGFQRIGDPNTGGSQVRRLTTEMSIDFGARFTIFGNDTDRRTLRPELGNLTDPGQPDSLPDFVSRAIDAEALIARSGGNAFDCFHFTAYNFTTQVVPDTSDPGIRFSDLNSNLDDTYSRYSSFDLPLTTSDVAADPRVSRTVSVWVDHEATSRDDFRTVDPSDPGPFDTFLFGQLPTQFYAGMLDQYFQAIRTGPATLGGIARDGRVRDFTPWPSPAIPTGTSRFPFGVALDGVLYDSFFGALPQPRPRDEFFQIIADPLQPGAVYASQFFAANRLDVDPNSPELLGLPLVSQTIAETGALSNRDLLPRHGGVSGGYVSLRGDATPSFFLESALPGSHFPGLHAGYLIRGRPSQMTDPISEAIEDDIEDVSLMRNGPLGGATGTPPVEEDVFLGTRQPRRVLVYGSDLDKKAPVETAVRISSRFAITTDPANVTPENPEAWKIKAGLRLDEKPDPMNFSLLATTMSDGDEEAQKIIADAVIDLTVDIIANAVLNTVTSGGYLAACGGGVTAKQVSTAALNLGVGLGENEFLGVEPGKKGPLALALTGLVNDVDSPISGYAMPSLQKIRTESKLVPDSSSPTGVKRFSTPSHSFPQAPTLNHCDLLALPFSALKDAIKGQVTVRGLGGKGSAEAVGMRVLALCIPLEAQLDDGTFSAYASVTRRANIQPREQSPKRLSELPWQTVWNAFPYADEVSDEQIINDLYAALESQPDDADDINRILRATGSFSLIREMDRESIDNLDLGPLELLVQERRESLYQEYKLRHWLVPQVSLYVGPGHDLGAALENGVTIPRNFGDYQLTPNVSQIPVSYGMLGTVARTNENGNARARLSHPGVEMRLIAAVIQPPAEESN